eukprot:evm.model.NODE_49416_length_6225_cov_23.907631.1
MTLAKLDYHDDLTQRLQALSKDGEIPHLLFYGPPGAGKKTRIMALLREIYGAGVEKTRLEHKTFKTPTKRTIELTILASAYHQEINAAEAGSGDRFVVQEVIKEIAQSYNPTAALGLAGGRAFKEVKVADWEEYIGKLATMLIEEQSPPRLVLARDMLYELLTNCIPPDVILKTLLRELLPKLDDQLKHEVVYWAAFYEHRVQVGSKEIFHLEAFVAKFMALYKAFVINMFGF